MNIGKIKYFHSDLSNCPIIEITITCINTTDTIKASAKLMSIFKYLFIEGAYSLCRNIKEVPK